ncbi:uncharacterized protein LOC129749216 [Uranotaenia lowii]|uniref:uncharacterized protein LOC129749216 n=1 Tax=Uranotaenia lowii TaxID=190385 RepID=UPI0024794FD6|nr:uncharacterized protein LOC129749216 [Uranotaenia lowii]
MTVVTSYSRMEYVDDNHRLVQPDQQREGLAKRIRKMWYLALVFFFVAWMVLVGTFSRLIWTWTSSAVTSGETVVFRVASAEGIIKSLLSSNNTSKGRFPLTCSLSNDEVVLMDVGETGNMEIGLFQDNRGMQRMILDGSNRRMKRYAGECMVVYLKIMKHYTEINGLIAEISLPQGEIYDNWLWLSVMYRNSSIQYGPTVERWRIKGGPVEEVEEVDQRLSPN